MKDAERDYGVIAGALVAVAVVVAGGYAYGYVQGDNGQATLSVRSVGAVAERASASKHNVSDVEFFVRMEPHHEHALDMAKVAERRANSREVRTLAFKIEAAQASDIDAMVGWLDEWGTAASMHGGAADQGSLAELQSLKKSPKAGFDRRFLELMIAHHETAITMASGELRKGINAQALALAASTQVTLQAEVALMESLQEK